MSHKPTVLSTSGRSEHALRPGYHLAQWEIQQLIGEGGFSLVYQAIDKHTHQKVAIKNIFPHQCRYEILNKKLLFVMIFY